MSAPGRLDRAILLVAVAVVGFGLASAHWLGILVGAIAVGAFGRTTGRGVLLGLGFGVLVAVAFAWELWAAGQLDRVLAMGEIAAIGFVVPIVLGAIGGLARGLIPTGNTTEE